MRDNVVTPLFCSRSVTRSRQPQKRTQRGARSGILEDAPPALVDRNLSGKHKHRHQPGEETAFRVLYKTDWSTQRHALPAQAGPARKNHLEARDPEALQGSRRKNSAMPVSDSGRIRF